MNRLIFIAALVLIVESGCKQKPKEPVPDTAPPPPAPSGSPAPSANANTGGGISAAGGVGVVVNPSAALGGGGGGGGVMAVRKAARRTQALNEMRTLGQAIAMMQDEYGRMPTKEQIVAGLKSYPKVLEAVNEGAFILTGTTEAGGLWAYEVGADTQAGIALIGGTATRTTPDELRPYFQGK